MGFFLILIFVIVFSFHGTKVTEYKNCPETSKTSENIYNALTEAKPSVTKL